jgi:hypothetical protein
MLRGWSRGWCLWFEPDWVKYQLTKMRSYLINKNLCFYYWLRRGIGKKEALRVANTIEKILLVLGREAFQYPR